MPQIRYKKSDLIKLISKKVKINKLHTLSVVNILIEEIITELKNNNKIIIRNFGYFIVNKLKPKKIKSIVNNKIKFVNSTYALRFRLYENIYNLIKQSVENEKKSKNNSICL